ncbi:hypothetical protein FKM82_011272 [Ascaphus truei]
MSEDQIPVHEEFIYCCGAATQVLKFGPWNDLQKNNAEIPPNLLILIVPGNPGIVGYYRTFMQALYCGLDQQYPVWAVSHAGHCAPPRGMDMTDVIDCLYSRTKRIWRWETDIMTSLRQNVANQDTRQATLPICIWSKETGIRTR